MHYLMAGRMNYEYKLHKKTIARIHCDAQKLQH